MSSCLKIGDRLFDGDQIISALVRYQLLEPFIGQMLLDQVINDVPLSQEELYYTLVGVSESPVPDDFESFLVQWCDQNGVTLDYFKAVTLRELQLQKFKQIQFANQVESEFLRVQSELDQVDYSLIQLNDLSLAQELYFQLRDDDVEFAQLAEHYSLGSEYCMGGRVGLVSLSTLPIAVATVLRRTQVGTVCEPILVGDRVWIIRLEQLTPARLTEATRDHLINRMYSGWLNDQVQTVLNTPGAIACIES